jgi:hypothetical protein
MASGWKRYRNVRMVLGGGTVGLLAVVWGTLAVRDEIASQASEAAAQASAGAGLSTAADGSAGPASAPTPAPTRAHTKTKGS